MPTHTHTHMLITQLLLTVCISSNTGKALSIPEGKTAYQWFCRQWANLMPHFLAKPAASSSSSSSAAPPAVNNDEEPTKKELAEMAFILQHLLMAHLIYLSGGQRCQVYAGMLLSDISWISETMRLYVPNEKISHLNTSQLPLPPQLFTSIEFFVQRVRPHLFHDPVDAKLPYACLWVTSHGGAVEPNDFSNYVWQAFNEFNEGLDLTPLDFRRRTVIGLWASTTTPPLPLPVLCCSELFANLSLSLTHYTQRGSTGMRVRLRRTSCSTMLICSTSPRVSWMHTTTGPTLYLSLVAAAAAAVH